MLYPGQKVVCVSVTSRRGNRCAFIEIGKKYTIRRVYFTPRGNPIVNLMEATGPLKRDGHERGFPPQNFRPICAEKTDISVFTKMLTDAPAKIDA